MRICRFFCDTFAGKLKKRCVMAINAAVIWEIRTTGSNTNGGGFKLGATGVDYSQQAAAQWALTGVTTSGTGAVFLTSQAAATMVGNTCRVVSGTNFTVGWYEIISVSAGVSVTVDRNCCSGAGSNGVINIGGAFKIGGSLDSDFFGTTHKTLENTVYIQSGTYTAGEAIQSASTILVVGYKTARGDNPTGNDRPTINVSSYGFTTLASIFIRNVIFTGTSAQMYYPGGQGTSVNCKFENTSTTANREALRDICSTFIGCEMVSTAGYAIGHSGAGAGQFLFCYIHDSSVGFYLFGQIQLMVGCVIDTCGTGIDGTSFAPGTQFIQTSFNNTIYNCTNGILENPAVGATQYGNISFNNIISACGTGLNGTGTASVWDFLDYTVWNNTIDIAGSRYTKGSHDITNDPLMTSPATGVFTIGSDSIAANAALDTSTYCLNCTV
jgi:hypothetical protein